MIFRAIVTKSKSPFIVRRISDGRVFPEAYMVVPGNNGWKPQSDEIVLCTEDDEGYVYITGRVIYEKEDVCNTGTQLGDNKNGIQVTEDGTVVTLIVDVNLIKLTEEGLLIDYEKLTEKGNGYLKTVAKAEEANGAAALETKLTETLHSPAVDEAHWKREITGTGTAVGAVTVNETVGSKWASELKETGEMIISKMEKFQFGTSGSEPAILGAKMITLFKLWHDWINTHVHATPAGPSNPGLDASSKALALASPKTNLDNLKSGKVKLTD